MESRRSFWFVLLTFVLLVSLFQVQPASAQSQAAAQYQVLIDHAAHQQFGLYYPVTYMFQIPGGSSGLTAQYRYSQAGAWVDLPLRTASDFFNGIQAARFDYNANVAYLSVAFSPNSDELNLRVLGGQNEVPISYLGMPRYYDNRRAAVTVSLDDWNGANDTPGYVAAAQFLTGAQVHFTSAVIASSVTDWPAIQTWINSGYMEAASHTRSHACSEGEYSATGYSFEIQGSRDAILANLSLPHPYLPVFIEPCGFENAQVRQAAVNANYLVTRGWQAPPFENGFSSWGADGAYPRTMYSYDTWDWGWYTGTTEQRDAANQAFDAAYSSGGIYHLVDHPWTMLWSEGSNLVQHLGHISGRPDVWYAAFGELYLYHFVQDRGLVSVTPLGEALPTFTPTVPPVTTPTETATPTETGLPAPSDTPTSTALPTGTNTPTASSTPVPPPTSTPTATLTPTPSEIVNPADIAALPVGSNVLLNFDNFPSPSDGRPIPAGYAGCTWTTLVEGSPWAGINTWNIYITNGGSQGSITFPVPVIVKSVRVSSGGSNTFTLISAGNPNAVLTTSGNNVQTLTTGWTNPVTSLTLRSTTFDQVFDDLRLTTGGSTASPTPTFTSPPGSTPTATFTPSPLPPTNTPTLTPSPTPVPPTSTVTSTPTSTTIPTPTFTLVPTSTPGGVPTQFRVTIDPAAHQRYGLYYPVTYMFRIPSGASGLSAQYRTTAVEAWTNLDTKTSSELFSGVNAARFDYANHVAYLSVGFKLSSDALYLRVLDTQGEVPLSYLGIPKYYDNRTAAVTVSLDDWDLQNENWNLASQVLTDAHVHFTGAIISTYSPDWSLIQYWYDRGYMEPGGHSRTHPCTDSGYQVNGYAWEIAGVRDDILSHLSMRFPYVPSFELPCGYESPQIRQALVDANYIADRGAAPYLADFAPWVDDGAYERAMYTGSTFGWEVPGTAALRDEVNAAFDAAYAAGGIYHLTDHPNAGMWTDGPYIGQHIAHISNHLDVWYAAFGELYLYHYVQERGMVNVSPVGGTQPTDTPTGTPLPTFTSTATLPPPTSTFTPTYTGTATVTRTPTLTSPAPTNTWTSTATALPPTSTDTPTATALLPTSTDTSTPTALPPTSTSTPTATFTPTNTAPPPTSTWTPTATFTPSPSPTQPADLIFANGFESGNFTGWSSSVTNNGALSVSPAAALVGSYGMQANINSNASIYVTDNSPANEARYRARFYFNPNSVAMNNGNAHYILYGLTSGGVVTMRIEFGRSSTSYRIRAALSNNSTSFSTTSWFNLSNAIHYIEVDWRAATAVGANNGGLTFWIDGVQRGNLTGVSNDARRIETVRLGAVAGVDSGTRGVVYFDAFQSNRQTYIGP